LLTPPLVEIQNQVLGQAVRIVGTPFSLCYRSDRVPGRRAAYTLKIPLTGTALPPGLENVVLEVAVCGRSFTQEFQPTPERAHTFAWDGNDVQGRFVPGKQLARIRIGYVYPASYPRPEITRWRESTAPIGAWDAREVGLGGWTLNVHHFYDRVGHVLYLGDGRRRNKMNATQPLSAVGGGDRGPSSQIFLPAEDGGEIYIFDETGRHLRTLHELTGSVLYSFEYTANGGLAAVQNGHGDITRIERAEPKPRAIVGPYGQRTNLRLDADGYLARIQNPADELSQLGYTAGGLLASLTDPTGNVHRFIYDAEGRLTRHEDPAGGVSALERAERDGGFEVLLVTALQREFAYRVEHLGSGEERQVNKCCGAGAIVAVGGPNGCEKITFPDGTSVALELEPDPRLGAGASLVRKAVVKTPSGLTRATTTQRQITLADERNPLRLTSQTDAWGVNGRQYTTTFEAARGQIVATTPGGRRILTLDERGLVVRVESAGLAPVIYRYDAHGRPTAMEWGPRRVSTSYDAHGRPSALTHADGTTYYFVYDDAGRVVQVTLPSGRHRRFADSPSGYLTQLTMPSGAVHRFERDAVDRELGYVAPGGERLMKSYDRDHRLTTVTLPDGRAISLRYQDSGVLAHEQYAEAEREFSYEPASQRLTGLTRVPVGGGPSQQLTYAWDGFLLTEIAWSGESTGRYRYRYDDSFLLAGVTLDGGHETALGRDADRRLTEFGPFNIAREGPGSAPTGISGGPLNVTVEYDDLGRIRAGMHRVNDRDLYRFELVHDVVGRITEKREIVLGKAAVHAYAYDPDGQLVEVRRHGAPAERYTYDADGNRTSRTVEPERIEAARYAEDDRLLERGGITYHYDAAGFLTERGPDAFTYSARGELLTARLADGRTVTYGYDATGRRVSRTDRSGTSLYFYGNLARPFQVTAVRSPSGILDVYWYDNVGHLFAIQRDQGWCYVATDHLGTPWVICDIDAKPVKVLAHDSFGTLIADSNPELHFAVGFAGGLADPATALVRFGLRDYEPIAGRWTSKDPIGFGGSDPNLYGYIGNDPVNFVDPSGLQEEASGVGSASTRSAGTGLKGIGGLGGEPGGSGIDWKPPSPGGLDDPNWSPGQPSGPGEGIWKHTHGSDAPKEPGYNLWKHSWRRTGGAGRWGFKCGFGPADSPTDPKPNPIDLQTGNDIWPGAGPFTGSTGQGGVSLEW